MDMTAVRIGLPRRAVRDLLALMDNAAGGMRVVVPQNQPEP